MSALGMSDRNRKNKEPNAPVASGAVPPWEPTPLQDTTSRTRSAELSRHDQRPPAQVPGYTILRCLGRGGYGSVWLAYQQKTGKRVAIKFYYRRRGLDWTLLCREIEKLALLYTSRYIVRLIDVGWDSQPPYFVMEYLENGSLQTLLDRQPLPPDRAVRLVKSILRGLIHAHGCGVLHCDLKPANVLLDGDMEPRLCDFGQSRLSNQQEPALGTLFYMAPEQADLHAVPDARWDVYALGALFYHLLVGHPPHRTPDNERRIEQASGLSERLRLYRQIVYSSPLPSEHRRVPGVDRRLADIVDRCLSPDPEQRFPNAQAVLDALELRDRQLARRPLIALGLIGPVVLMLGVLPVAMQAMSRAVRTAQSNQIDRALESDALSARILSRGLEQELTQRKSELIEICTDPALRQAIEAAMASQWKDRQQLWSILSQWYERADRRRRERGVRPDASWFLCDADGFQRWRSVISITLDKNWAHRDYFHGRNVNYPPGQAPPDVGPISKPHISVAYRGTSEQKYKVAISAPIFSSDGKRVIGVLARTSELGDLLADYELKIHQKGQANIRRVITLVDQRDGKLLYHPWIYSAHQRNVPDRIDVFERLRVNDDLLSELDKLRQPSLTTPMATYRTASYFDPVGRIAPERFGGRWLAAFCPVRSTSWVAGVQEPFDAAVQPVQRLDRELKGYFWTAVLVFFVLLGAVWLVVARLFLTDEKSRPGWVSNTKGSINRTAFP